MNFGSINIEKRLDPLRDDSRVQTLVEGFRCRTPRMKGFFAELKRRNVIRAAAGDGGSQIACVYAFHKEPEKMFEWLEHAVTTHDAGVQELLSEPFLRAYKDDLRFIAFAQKIGVMPKTAGKP